MQNGIRNKVLALAADWGAIEAFIEIAGNSNGNADGG